MGSEFIFFKNKWILITFFVVLIQQILVASGTFFLGNITKQYSIEGFNVSTALMLFFCVSLPGTVFHYLVSWSTVHACKQSQYNYLTSYTHSSYNYPEHWRNQDFKQQKHDIMCRGGQESIQTFTYFLADFTSTCLNVLLNTISIIIVTNLTLGSIIIFSGFLGMSIVHLRGPKITKASRNEMLADNLLNSHLSISWDNIILGNQLFFDRWKERFETLFSETEKASLITVKKNDKTIALAGMITNGLVLGGALSLAWLNRNSPGFVLAILVMLPRCLQVVMHIQVIQTYFAQWKRLREKLKVTLESVTKPQRLDLSKLINHDDIRIVFKDKCYSSREIEKQLENMITGRFTVLGENGVGKSTLLLMLKHKFNQSAIYCPAQHHLMLPENQTHLSTGETALAIFHDIQSSDRRVLLLDEWDANLSKENRAILNQKIEYLSRDRIIIEVRHSITPEKLQNGCST
ncbi:MAG: hypothetical protein WAM28_02405 [Chlamydiales bacterium]